MLRVLYVDADGEAGATRFRALERCIDHVIWLPCHSGRSISEALADSKYWDLVVIDTRGVSDADRPLMQQALVANPDAMVVLVVEDFNGAAAQTMMQLAAVDCVTWDRGVQKLATVVRRTLARLTVANVAISTMNGSIEEFDIKRSIGFSVDCADSLANDTLKHVAQMDVCGLRKAMRAVRAFHEALKQTFRNELEALAQAAPSAETPLEEPSSVAEHVFARTRIHLSPDGLRFTLQSTHSAYELSDLWFTPLFMDEISVDAQRRELTMLMLPDEVSQHVSQAIERCRDDKQSPRTLLTDTLKRDFPKNSSPRDSRNPPVPD
ncbi:hypothetical protein [Roseimaritima ulvae]|uniref:Uncharacterized protein n=1 Tax=Roseimaritima ulvae TaxID=980254 RepID=A0A5B9R7T4_9BACT|nr:hypothetical protein [Roseimaritima ulvae]QEG42523.1 hypothetical protein UC8_45620 [Roseimaritima ulvae]